MSAMLPLSRRNLLAAGGAVVVSFALRPSTALAQGPRLPGSLTRSPWLDSWIRIDADGTITVFTGKVELGQGIKTALLQVAAEELEVEPQRITLITADTGATPDEGYTAGSQSMDSSGVAILNAAAQVRAILIQRAAERFKLPVERLRAENGAVLSNDGQRATYGDLVADKSLHIQALPQSPLKDASTYKVIGRPLQRVDIPAKVTGGLAYVHDLRLPNMVHARVVRPPSYSARLASIDSGAVEKLPGVLKVVRDGSFLAVAAEREYGAVAAMRALAAAARWEESKTLPSSADLFTAFQGMRSEDSVILERGQSGAAAHTVEATYRRPYQMHGSIGPSCAVALWQDDALSVWTHSQGVYPLRQALSGMLRVPTERVRCTHMEGAGCYGHNGADDVAADAALIARAMPGRPVRVQWMREQEHGWEPFGSAMIGKARGGLDENGNIVDFQYEVWSTPHSTRPGGPGNLLPAWHLATPFTQPTPRPIPQPSGGGDRNAIPYYRLPNARVVSHFLPDMPLRVSALRALGGYMNVFAVESFMDEMAKAAGADPVQFRLRHLDDPRARDVLSTAAESFGWSLARNLPRGRGVGIAFARYKNFAGYCAVAVEVEVERTTGRVRVVRATAAADSGQAVNPDGIRNQIEGAILQAASWTLFEQVTFDATRVTSRDWSSYPILRFPDVPERIEVLIVDRAGQPYLGTGEAGQGPTAAAIANAVASATGARIRDLPLTRERVRAALGV